MKNIITLLAFVFATNILLAQKVNEKVQIEHNGTWYPGKILKVNESEGIYFITYDGWDENWNEWVTRDRLKGFREAQPLTKFKVGDMVEVEYGMVPEPARVIEVGENKYKIEYEKKVFGTKWVTEKQMKKL